MSNLQQYYHGLKVCYTLAIDMCLKKYSQRNILRKDLVPQYPIGTTVNVAFFHDISRLLAMW